MAAKTHKAKKSSIRKAAAASRLRQEWPWSELPPTQPSIHPHNLRICRYRLLPTFTAAPAVTKSSPPPPSRCQLPRPRLRHVTTAAFEENPTNPRRSHSHFLADGASIADAVYELPDASHWCYLRSGPVLEPGSHLGPNLWANGVSLGPNAPTSALMVSYSIGRDTSLSSRRYTQTSIRHECTTPDPFDAEEKFLEFTSLLHFRGKYYATSLQGALVVMEVVHTRLRITAVGPARGVPSSDSRFSREYLFEMDGEICLVFLIHERSVAVVDRVEAFRLDLDKLCWIKIERLKGKVMFLNDWCFWGKSERIGCRDDRVYFTQGILEKSWRVWDMKNCCILPGFENEWGQRVMNM